MNRLLSRDDISDTFDGILRHDGGLEYDQKAEEKLSDQCIFMRAHVRFVGFFMVMILLAVVVATAGAEEYIVTLNGAGNSYYLPINGDGTLGSPAFIDKQHTFPSWTGDYGAGIGHFTNDENYDFVVGTGFTYTDYWTDPSNPIILSQPKEIYLYEKKDSGNSFSGPSRISDWSSVSYTDYIYARDMAVADFDGNGLDDFVMVRYGTHDVGLYLNNGDGSFSHSELTGAASPYSAGVDAADINNDGYADFVVGQFLGGDQPYYIYVNLGNGDGTFSTYTIPTAYGFPSCGITAADFDGDGYVDLIALAANPYGVSGFEFYKGDGTGDFIPTMTGWFGAFMYYNSIVDNYDLDGDGDQDIVASYEGFNPNGIMVGLNDGHGNFEFSGPIIVGSGEPLFAIAAPPVIHPAVSPNEPPVAVVSVIPDVRSIITGTTLTFSSDGSFDPEGEQLEYRWSFSDDGSIVTTQGEDLPHQFTIPGLWDVTLTLTDNYGETTTKTVTIDVAAVVAAEGPVYIVTLDDQGKSYYLESRGDGTLAPQRLIGHLGPNTYGAGIGEFTNDEYYDFVVGTGYTGGPSKDIYLYQNNGPGNSFLQPVPIGSWSAGEYPADMPVADFDGDGHDDFVMVRFGSQDVGLYRNDGNGGFFHSEIAGAAPLYSVGADAADINHDGYADFVVASNEGDPQIYVNLGNGDGSFKPPIIIPVPFLYTGITAADFDGDYKVDLIATIAGDPNIANGFDFYRGDGSGGFTRVESFGDGWISGNAPVDNYDLDGDGDQDLISANLYLLDTSAVIVGLNDGTGRFTFGFDSVYYGGGGGARITIAAPPVFQSFPPSTQTWTQATALAAFPGRYNAALAVYDGKLWLIGGTVNGIYQNDVWYSSDGVTWTQATAHAGFSSRTAHGAVVFNGKLWVIGGDTFGETGLNDVWYSSDGVIWTQAIANAAFSPRCAFATTIFDGKLWIIGGSTIRTLWYEANDVWYSSDGVTWEKATDQAAFSVRSDFRAVVFDNKMWIFGGWNGQNYFNDVWSSSDGITWEKVTTSAEFVPRSNYGLEVFENKMWMIGGQTAAGGLNDVWYSSDGSTWTQDTPQAAFSPRLAHNTAVFNQKMWVIAGFAGNTHLNDVWYSGAPQPPQTGSISINSVPSGAKIYLDDVYQGLTPQSLENIPFGVHIVKLSLDNYQDWSDNVELTAASPSASVNPTLNPVPPTYSMTNTFSVDAGTANCDNMTSALKGIGWGDPILYNTMEVVTKADFGVNPLPLQKTLNDATLHYHVGHGVVPYEVEGNIQSGLGLYDQPNNFLSPSDVENKWGNKNKWVILHSCYALQDERWGKALSSSHGVLGFKTMVNINPGFTDRFFHYAIDETESVYDAFKDTTYDLYRNDPVPTKTIDGKPDYNSTTEIPVAAVVFGNQPQADNDHLPGIGTVAPDANPGDTLSHDEWRCNEYPG